MRLAVGGWRAALVALIALLLAACSGQELYSGVSEAEANDMVAALMTAGIRADKSAADKETWSVTVASGDFPRAVQVLQANGLPRTKYESMGDVFKKENFATSELSEHARLVYALSEELSDTISRYDGVVDARVHVNLPDKPVLGGEVVPGSASVFVKYRPGFNVRSQTAAIKTLVSNGVEGLGYDRVSVVMTEAAPLPAAPTTDWTGGLITALAWLAALAGLATLLAISWTRWRGRAGAAGLPSVRDTQ